MTLDFAIYLLVMAGVTYLTRCLPMLLVREKIKSRFLRSFFYCLPYTILAAMTVPGIFYATGFVLSAVIGFAVAVFVALRGKSVISVAVSGVIAVLLVELLL